MNEHGSNIIDSILNRERFATPEIAAMFTDENRVQKWLDIEAALAATQAELGMIPPEAAQEIVRKAKVELIDLEEIAAAISEISHNLVPVIRAHGNLCDGNAGEYIHYGATTQDIVDTGMTLQVKARFWTAWSSPNATRLPRSS